MTKYGFGKRRFCPHEDVEGIYGDAIIFATPNFNRLFCRDCNRFLGGPVSIAQKRRELLKSEDITEGQLLALKILAKTARSTWDVRPGSALDARLKLLEWKIEQYG